MPWDYRANANEPEPTKHMYYVCPHCWQPLELVEVLRVDPLPIDGLVQITHWCELVESQRVNGWVATKYPRNQDALRNLFGEVPSLPYTALGLLRATQGQVLEVEDAGPVPDPESAKARRDRAVAIWQWHLDHLDSADEFLDLARGPKSQDAEVRASFWKRWRGRAAPGATPPPE